LQLIGYSYRDEATAAILLGGRLLGDVVARKRADTAGATVDADTPAVVEATHHSDQITFT